ncbi:hypothetical protein ACFYE8_28000 [Rhizobium leguminosarum]|uniref:hypothetical protein n=1 Tax=Rhizobium leguminosarum TaxID=384 RepID=UPI0036DA9DF9
MDNTGWEWPNNAPDDEVSWIAQLAGTLNLGSTTADQDSGAIGRTSMGGSMRIPRQPSLRGNQISSARHSIDTSYEASSRSRHSTASSEGYSFSPEGPVIAPQPKKSGGLKSLLKSVKKAFVPSSGKKSSKDWTHQPDFVQTTYRVDYAKRGRPDDSPDEAMFAQFKERMDAAREADPAGGRSVATVQKLISALRGFGEWLQARHLSLAQLIDEYNLDDLVTSYVGPGSSKNVNNVNNALAVLRASRAGNVRRGSRVTGDPYLDDQNLIDGYLAYAGGGCADFSTEKHEK